MSNFRLVSQIFVATATLAACSSQNAANVNSAGAIIPAMSSVSLAKFFSSTSAQAAAKAQWANDSRLSPGDFSRQLLSRLQDSAVTVDGISVSGMHTQFAKSLASFDALSKQFSTIGELLDTAGIKVQFASTASDLVQEFSRGTKGAGLALQDATQTAPETPAQVQTDEKAQAQQIDGLTVGVDIEDPSHNPVCVGGDDSIDARITRWKNTEDYYNNHVSFGDHINQYTRNLADLQNPGSPDVANSVAAQNFQLVADEVDACQRTRAANDHGYGNGT